MTDSISIRTILTGKVNFEEHRKRMIEHFLYLREKDRDYAIDALYEYKQLMHCPFPDIHKDVKVAFDKVQNENISSV